MIIFTIIVAITNKWKWQSVKIRTICELGGALMCVKGWGKGDGNRYYKKNKNKNGLVKMLSSISFPNNWNVSDVFLHLIAAIPMQGLLEKIHWMRGGINPLNKPKQNIKKIFPAFWRVDSCHHRVEGNTELLKRELVPQFGLYTLATKSFWVIGSSALDLPLHQRAKTPGTLSQDPIG